MSYRVLFEGMLSRLKRRRWGVSIKQPDLPAVDSGVQDFADELAHALASDSPITISRPIRIKRTFVGPVFLILDDDAEAIAYLAPDGTQSSTADPLTKTVKVLENLTITETISAVRT